MKRQKSGTSFCALTRACGCSGTFLLEGTDAERTAEFTRLKKSICEMHALVAQIEERVAA